jgi:hypothetical protein
VKQERRGGIETWTCNNYSGADDLGSRNAVVALKPYNGGPQLLRLPPKQERRGGIETAKERTFPTACFGKQERRGGIETRAAS